MPPRAAPCRSVPPRAILRPSVRISQRKERRRKGLELKGCGATHSGRRIDILGIWPRA